MRSLTLRQVRRHKYWIVRRVPAVGRQHGAYCWHDAFKISPFSVFSTVDDGPGSAQPASIALFVSRLSVFFWRAARHAPRPNDSGWVAITALRPCFFLWACRAAGADAHSFDCRSAEIANLPSLSCP